MTDRAASPAEHELPADTVEPQTDRLPAQGVVRVVFSGEVHIVEPGGIFTIGRDADLSVDTNHFLHRAFLQLSCSGGMWWLANVGSRLSATVSSASGAVQSWLSPGARLPLVFDDSTVVFSAGPTTYEVSLHLESAPYGVSARVHESASGEETILPVSFTASQKRLIVALAEPMLRREGVSVSELPSSAAAAERLGWSISKFNRKLDFVCEKLDRFGVPGLRGGPGRLATNRRARLVEYAVSSQLIGRMDLPLLEAGDADDG